MGNKRSIWGWRAIFSGLKKTAKKFIDWLNPHKETGIKLFERKFKGETLYDPSENKTGREKKQNKLKKLHPTYTKTYKKLYKGKSLEEIANERNRSIKTIKKHYAVLKDKGII